MKNYEPIAYNAKQYAPALCIWREVGDIDAFSCDYVRIGYMDDARQPAAVLRWQVVKYAYNGRPFVRYHNRRYYLDEFMKF